MIRPLPERRRPGRYVAIAASAAALWLLATAAGMLGAMALQGRVAAYRPVAGTVSACPAASREVRP